MDLLRHGEPEGGTRFRGTLDDPLSPLGWEQMRRATAGAGDWTRVISSPSRRCLAFARELAETHAIALAECAALRERDFGDWEGLAPDQIPSQALQAFWDDPVGYAPPGAEPFPDFRARVLGAWGDLLRASEAQTLVVTHGGVIRVLLAEVLRMADEALLSLEVPHACLSRLRLYPPPGRASLVFHGTL
nr:histidine phosphatase family protein [Thiocystis violacea]